MHWQCLFSLQVNLITMVARIAWHFLVNIRGTGMMNRVALKEHLFVNYTVVLKY